MAERAPFDPSDPFEALADLARREIAQAGMRILDAPEYRDLHHVPAKQVQATLIGVLTGVSGIAISQMTRDDDGHAEIRAWLLAALPQAFDQARSILDMPPLPEARN